MISVVMCTIDEARFQAASQQYRRALGNEPHEIIGVRHPRSMCAGYNQGLDASRGDIVIFSHDDIELWTPDFMPRLKRHVESFDVVGVAGTDLLVLPGWIAAGPPHVFGKVAHGSSRGPYLLMVYGVTRKMVGGIQAMDGLFLAFRRDVIKKIRWDEETFRHFHCYDTDCTYRAYKAGYRLGVALDLALLHMSKGTYDNRYATEGEIFKKKHGIGAVQPPQFARILAEYRSKDTLAAAMEALSAHLPER